MYARPIHAILLCKNVSGLFRGNIGLFCGDRCLSCGDLQNVRQTNPRNCPMWKCRSLLRKYRSLCGHVGLLCEDLGLFYRDTCLFCLFCRPDSMFGIFFCGDIGMLFCGVIRSTNMFLEKEQKNRKKGFSPRVVRCQMR